MRKTPDMMKPFGAGSALYARMLFHNTFQRGGAAGMAAFNADILAARLDHGAVDHFVGDCIGKQDHQIRRADLILHAAAHLSKNLGPAAASFADISVLTLHAVIPADDHHTHIVFPFLLRF